MNSKLTRASDKRAHYKNCEDRNCAECLMLNVDSLYNVLHMQQKRQPKKLNTQTNSRGSHLTHADNQGPVGIITGNNP